MNLLRLFCASLLWLVASPAQARTEVVRLMLIEPFSGPLASVGQSALSNWKFIVDEANAHGGAGGRPIELLHCDNKGQPRDTDVCFNRAVDANVRYVIQGLSSAPAIALLQAVAKHNARNPGREMIYLDWAAQAEALTNELCNEWHFRFDAHTGMKIHALVRFLAEQPGRKRVYLLNQDYSTGYAVRDASRAAIAALPGAGIEIVGDELVPFNKVNDWTPYVAKLRASGADYVITGNWGNDLTRLVKTAAETGVDLKWYTLFGGLEGMATVVGKAGVGRVIQVTDYHINLNDPVFQARSRAYEKAYGSTLDTKRADRTLELLLAAIRKAGSADPAKVAPVLANIEATSGITRVRMRPSDHQLQMPLVISTMSDEVAIGRENTPYGFRTNRWYSAAEVAQPTSCVFGRSATGIAATGGSATGHQSNPGARLSGETVALSIANGLAYGMLLFLLSSGLTLIFSMMGVLNFAHAAFYMLGAYIAYQISSVAGFWVGLLAAPVIVALLGAAVERLMLRRVYRFGHLAELLLTFGLALLIEEIVVLVWGPLPVDFRVPASLDFPLLQIFGSNISAYRVFILGVSALTLLALYLGLVRTRFGLVVRAALTHPDMTAALGHNVSFVFTSTFAIGCGLAGLAGAIAGNLLGTDPGMAVSLGTIIFVIVVVGGLGSLLGAFVASLLIGILQTLAVTIDLSPAMLLTTLGVEAPDAFSQPISRFAPLLPYLLMVLMLIVRPRGFFGRRDL